MATWILHKFILAYCTACLKYRMHELGHFAGRKGDCRICTKCDFVTEVDSEDS